MNDMTFRPALGKAFESALDYLSTLDRRPVASTVDIDTLRSRLGKVLQDAGRPAEDVINELVKDVDGSILGSSSGRFFGWVIGGSLPSALAADWLTATWDQNAALYSCGAAAAIAEEVAGGWLKDVLGLPHRASYAFVTGAQMAHFTCLAAARHALLKRRGWDVEKNGLGGAPPIRILASEQRHGSIDRAIRFLGLGQANIVAIQTDSVGRIIPSALQGSLEECSSSAMIVALQAGDISTGAFDDFARLIPLSKRHNAWVHVDGAFGLWAGASPKYRHLVRGVDQADSWTTDGHKWLNVPFDCGYAIIADAVAHLESMSHRAAYLTHDGQARDQIDWNPEWSRRARGFPTYAALRELGRQGVADLIERSCEHTRALVRRLEQLPCVEILSTPVLNQALVRFLDSGPSAADEDHDRRTDEVIAAVVGTGEAFFTGTTWHGRRAMRVSICNWKTSGADINRAVEAFAKILGDPRQEDSYAEPDNFSLGLNI